MFFRRCFWDVATAWLVNVRSSHNKRLPYVSACTDIAQGSHSLNKAYCRSSQGCTMHGQHSLLQRRNTHSEQPWPVQSPVYPRHLLGLEDRRCGAEGGKELVACTTTPLRLPSFYRTAGLSLPLLPVAPSLVQVSLDKVASWEFHRVGRDWLNVRAPGWCCLKWPVTPLHLSALVPLKWNPTFPAVLSSPTQALKIPSFTSCLSKGVFI